MRRPLFQILAWLIVWLAAAAWLAAHIAPRDEGAALPYTMNNAVLAGQDTVSHDYPALWWGWRQIGRTGHIPLWNPSWFAGEPFVASQTFMPFYPPNWLGGVLPFPLAFNVQYPLHLLLAALAMAWACRRRGLGWLAAGLAGLSWGFGGHLATLVGPGHIQKLQTLAWLPVVTTGMRELAGERPRRGLLPFALGLALQVTAGHLQIVWLTLGAGALEALATCAVRLCKFRNPRFVFGTLGWGAAALALALGLSAAFWVPTVEFARLSNRQGKLSWEDETRGSLPPDEMFEFALPRLRGDSMPAGRGPYLGRYGESTPDSKIKLAPERVVSDYVGAGVLLFALFGLLAGFCAVPAGGGVPARRSGLGLLRENRALGYILLAAAALFLSMGRYHPQFYKFALAAIPGLAHFRSPSTMMAVFAWGMTLAAAIGVNEFVQGRTPYRFRILSGIFIVLLAAALAAARFAADPAQGKLVLAAGRHLAAGLGCVFAASIVWGLCARAAGGAALRRALAPLALGVLALAWGRDLLVNDRPFWTGIGEEPYRYWLMHHWALRNWEREEVPVRYIQLGNELSNQALTLSDYGPPNFREIASVHGYHPIAYGRYFDLLSRLGFTHPNFARLFGMQYMIAPVEAGVPPPGWQIVRQSDDKRFYLLYNPDMAYVRPVRHIQVVDDWPALLDRLADKNFNPYESTTVTFRDVDNNPEYDQKSIPLQDIRLNARVFPVGPGWIELRLTTARSGPIELAEPWAPGWRTVVDGRDLTGRMLLRLDGYFIGIAAPVGESVIQLYYDPASQRLGLYLTCLALAAVAFVAGFAAARRSTTAGVS